MYKNSLPEGRTGASTRQKYGRSQRIKKPKRFFGDESKESLEDFDLKPRRSTRISEGADGSSDLSFQFRAQPVAGNAKDLEFDKLFSHQNQNVVISSPFSHSSSSEGISHESSSDVGGGLFQSLEEGPENLPQPVVTRGKKKGKTCKPKLNLPTPDLTTSSGKYPEVFSDSTLDFVAKGIEDVKLTPDKDQDDKEWLEIIRHSGKARVVLEDIKNSLSSTGSTVLDQKHSTIATSLIHAPASLGKGCNMKLAYRSASSPVISKTFATSTPCFHNRVLNRISPTKSASSPNFLGKARMSLAQNHVQLKGGKNWRRSRLSVVPIFKNARRTTVHISNESKDMFDVKEDEEVEEEGEDSVFESPRKHFTSVIKEHLNHSSSYIVPNDNHNVSQETNVSILCEVEKSAEEKLLLRCSAKVILPFSDLYPTNVLKLSKKVGEGSFGEVFLLGIPEENDLPVLKVVPVDGTVNVNEQPQTKLLDMLAEIIVSAELSGLNDLAHVKGHYAPCFVRVRKCNLVEGSYPAELLDLWDVFDAERGSENDRPDDNLFAGQEKPQKFVTLEFSNGGQDLEHCTLKSPVQGLSVFLQVVHAIAVAESAFNFEHRDLHWGNILVKSCEAKEKKTFFLRGEVDRTFEVQTNGVVATIIDFSLSRLTSQTDSCVIFNNLAEDPDLFIAEGDYQFDIYRMMKEESKDDWKGFHPKTNVFWMHYLLKKLIGEVKYKCKSAASHKAAKKKMKHYEGMVLRCGSLLEFMEQIADPV